jgi:hypothetical protein
VVEAPAWQDLGVAPVDALGLTGALAVPWGADQRGLLLEVSSAEGRCFQLDALSDEAGHEYAGPAEPGPYCLACEQRTSVVAGGGLFALPSRGGPFTPSGALRFRLGLRDCDTLAPAGPASATEGLAVRARALGTPPERGLVPLRVVVTPASSFWGGGSLEPLRASLDAELAPAQLSVRLVEVTRLEAGAASDASFTRGVPEALEALLAQAPRRTDSAAITVVLAGCLLLGDPALHATSEPRGYVPHIPGGAGPADGVFIAGSLCGTPGPVPIAWAASSLAHVLAHELGHALGLYHSAEANGAADQLEDTDDQANLMSFRPSSAGASGLSPTQGELMRAHPVVVPVE